LLSVMVSIVRSELQLVRFVVMFFFFCELYDFVYCAQLSLSCVLTSTSLSVFWLCQCLSFLYYIIHFSVVYVFQVIAFCIVFFVLFFQFYSGFSGLTLERYFLFKRGA
jgi:hypothetical protein